MMYQHPILQGPHRQPRALETNMVILKALSINSGHWRTQVEAPISQKMRTDILGWQCRIRGWDLSTNAGPEIWAPGNVWASCKWYWLPWWAPSAINKAWGKFLILSNSECKGFVVPCAETSSVAYLPVQTLQSLYQTNQWMPPPETFEYQIKQKLKGRCGQHYSCQQVNWMVSLCCETPEVQLSVYITLITVQYIYKDRKIPSKLLVHWEGPNTYHMGGTDQSMQWNYIIWMFEKASILHVWTDNTLPLMCRAAHPSRACIGTMNEFDPPAEPEGKPQY
jgi:hypothetical protein